MGMNANILELNGIYRMKIEKVIMDEMIESAVEILANAIDWNEIINPCEYSPRGYCMREISSTECSQNYHDCENYFEGGNLEND